MCIFRSSWVVILKTSKSVLITYSHLAARYTEIPRVSKFLHSSLYTTLTTYVQSS
jgi:hypothetical protein